MSTDRHFDHPTATWAARGALLGAGLVMTSFVIAIALSGLSLDLLAVAALAAVFGGVGMGAMLGATLAQFQEPAPALVRTSDRSRP